MSSDSVPPSIPPRKRPVTPANRPTAKPSGTASKPSGGASKPSGGAGTPGRDETTTPRTGAAGGAGAGKPIVSGSGATPRPPVDAELTGHAPGAAYAPTATREPVGAPAAADADRADARPASTGVPHSPGEGEEPPSPLQVAVDSVTATLKKAAAATSAALASAKRPRTEDTTMSSSSSSAATDNSDTGAYATSDPTPRVTPTRPSAGRPTTIPAAGAPRRVRLAVSRVDPWSVMKLSFLLSVAIGIMIVVAAAVVWLTLDSLHVFSQIDTLVKEVLGTENNIDVLQYVEFGRILSAATLIAVVDVFLLTALSTIGAFLYNITAALVGGVHLTLTDE